MQVDEFLAFLTALMLIPSPLRSLVNMSGPLQQGIAAGQSVFELMDQPTEGSGGTRAIARARGEIEFRNVSFTYGERQGRRAARRELSACGPGETVAIVGRSGSGKTTLVGLVPRFYDVQQGSVLLDGVDVREYRLTDLRSQVSLVSQDVVLFNDTIRNNIAFNAIDKTDAAHRSRRRAPPMSWNSSRSSRRDSIPRCRIADRISPAASGSASRSRARCSRMRRC